MERESTDLPGPARRRPAARGIAPGVLFGMVLALWLVRFVYGSRPPAGEDVMAHLVRADFGVSHLVAHGRLDGWFPRFAAGHQEFLFNGPGLTWLIAGVRLTTFGALSNAGALKVVCVASFVALPAAMAFLARSYGLSRRAAEVAAVLTLGVSSPFGPGLEGLFVVGLVSHQVAAVFFCMALGGCLRILRRDDRRSRRLTTASLAALAVTHPISVLVLAVVVAVTLAAYAVEGRVSRAGLRRLGAAALVAAGLAAFWWVPLAAHLDLRGAVVTWGTPALLPRLGRIAGGHLLFVPGFAIGVVAAWGWLLTRRHRQVALVATPLAYLVVAHASLRLFGPNEVTLQLANRGLGYAGLIAVLSLALCLSTMSHRGGRRGHVAALAVAGVAVLCAAPGRGAAGQMPEPIPALRGAAAELSRVVPDGARFATQRDYPEEVKRTGVVHPDIWLAHASGENSLNGFNLESATAFLAALEPEYLDDQDPDVAARRLARLGVTHVVTTTDGLAGRLVASDRFRLVWRAAPIAVLTVQPDPDQPSPASLLSAPVPLAGRLDQSSPERLAFELETDQPAVVTVAAGWSPKWHPTLDGHRVWLARSYDGLIEVRVPAGHSRLVLTYRRDGWDRLGVAGTTLTLALVATRRRRRDSQLISRIFSRTA